MLQQVGKEILTRTKELGMGESTIKEEIEPHSLIGVEVVDSRVEEKDIMQATNQNAKYVANMVIWQFIATIGSMKPTWEHHLQEANPKQTNQLHS